MELTRELILEKVDKKDMDFFYGLYNGEIDGEYDRKGVTSQVKTVYDQNYGDGNEWTIALEFKKFGMFVVLEGYYSSWDSPSWDSCSHAEPYEYTETRYKPATLAYLRDKKITEVLKDE